MNLQPPPVPARDERLADKCTAQQTAVRPTEREMPCPMCGHLMPDLKGGKDTICPVCGFKDSCCY